MDYCIHEFPAVKALGPLFTLTEVQLWDDGSGEVPESLCFQESIKFINGDMDNGKIESPRNNGFCLIAEDLELAKQMNDLGLPLSFHTNKAMRYAMTSGKRKGTRKNNQQSPTEIHGYMLDSIKGSEEESRTPASVLSTSKMLYQNDIPKNGFVADLCGLSNLSLEWGDSLSSTACTSSLSNEHEYHGEVSDLGFDDSFGCRSGLGIDMLDKGESVPRTNEMMATGIHLDCVDHDNDGQLNDISLDDIKDADVVAYAQFSEQANFDLINSHQTVDFGEWVAYWDDFHMRTYFYNVQTEESTWDPPLGMEHLACGNISDDSTNIVAGLSELDKGQMDFRTSEEIQASCDLQFPHSLANDSRNDAWSLSQQLDGIAGNWLSADNVPSTKRKNKKKKVRRTKSNRDLPNSREGSSDLQGVSHELPPSASKYWCQRYLLFSRFDSGIKMDEEGWFSVTPEPLAKHHAARCGHGAIVDFFTGVGGNAIQFARWSKHVIAIDIDPIKINYAWHNAAIYGVDDRIDFIKGDSLSLAPKLKANTVFMSPPWGGPTYSKVKKFDINTMLKPRDGQYLFNTGKGIAPKIVMFLPKNVDINQLAELSLSATPPWSLEVEKNFLNGRLKAITAYFSDPSLS